MINFETKNLIIVCYPATAGGKFLINSLGLSDNAVFQDSLLAQKQVNSEFTQPDKVNFLMDNLKNTTKWNDLHLGCQQFFGINNELYYQYPPEVIKTLFFNKIVDTTSNSNLKFFIVAHWTTICRHYLDVWPNAKIIYFKNCENFINFCQRTSLAETWLAEAWNSIRGSDWPDVPQTIDQYENLNPDILAELKNNFFSFNSILSGSYNNKCLLDYHTTKSEQYPSAITWDTDNYFSTDKTIYEIKKLYDILNLNNFNEVAIREYHKHWINKLEELKNK